MMLPKKKTRAFMSFLVVSLCGRIKSNTLMNSTSFASLPADASYTNVNATGSSNGGPKTTVVDGMIKRKGCKCNEGKDLFHGELFMLGSNGTAENSASLSGNQPSHPFTAPTSWQIDSVRP